MGFTCILGTNTLLVGRYWDFNIQGPNDGSFISERLKRVVAKYENAHFNTLN